MRNPTFQNLIHLEAAIMDHDWVRVNLEEVRKTKFINRISFCNKLMKRRPKGRKPQNIIHHLFCQHRLITTHKEETIHREIIFTRRRTVQHWYTTSWTYIRRNQQIQGSKYQKSYKINSLWDPWCMIRICFRSPSINSKITSILSTFQIIKYQLQMI